MNPSRIAEFVDAQWESEVVPQLESYIRIPNKSPGFDPDWEANGHMQQAAEQLHAWIQTTDIRGMRAEIFQLPGRTPVLICEIDGQADGNVLLYGHYDKQPEFSGWHDGLGPWQPVRKNGRLYGRGGADDGYALFGSLTAIAALQRDNIPHARCLVLIEGCEESGSFDLPFYMDALSDRVGEPDLVVCLDAECGNYEQLWLTTSLRGMLPGTLSVEVLEEGVHSGAAGGVVPSSFRLLRQLIERVERADTGALADVLHVQIPPAVTQQATRVAEALGPLIIDRFPWAGSTGPADVPLADLVLANTWGPSLAVVGLAGAPQPADAGNTLRPGTVAKLVFRLPPILDAEVAAAGVKKMLEADPPHGARVTFELDHAQGGWYAPDLAPWLEESLQQASQAFFRQPMLTMGTGGTIPFMKMLGDRFENVQFMVTGVLGPNSNAHGPNEFLDIETGKRVTSCVAKVLADHAGRGRG